MMEEIESELVRLLRPTVKVDTIYRIYMIHRISSCYLENLVILSSEVILI